jgi:hypothetical protein
MKNIEGEVMCRKHVYSNMQICDKAVRGAISSKSGGANGQAYSSRGARGARDGGRAREHEPRETKVQTDQERRRTFVQHITATHRIRR